MEYLIPSILSRKSKVTFYSPYNFIREIDSDNYIHKKLTTFTDDKNNSIVEVSVNNHIHYFLLTYLPWDTAYFNVTSYKLFTVLYDHTQFHILTEAVAKFKTLFFDQSNKYIFIEIPSEDILLIQAFTYSQFKLIETRLTYYKADLDKFDNKRFPVRKATVSDIDNLKRVASEMRNVYDRFHADTAFDDTLADQYLATYIEQSLHGFADIVLTSNAPGLPSDCFLTAKYMQDEWEKINCSVSKMVLSAVAPTNKGWYYKLISEMTYHLKDIGAKYIVLNTQSTNRAVFKTWESLGYNLGATTHILSFYQ
jgi:dTDP-4-amino-4,6-dideoxy-D-galactose acyltransferase